MSQEINFVARKYTLPVSNPIIVMQIFIEAFE